MDNIVTVPNWVQTILTILATLFTLGGLFFMLFIMLSDQFRNWVGRQR